MKPMLAGKCPDFDKLKFPLWASPKIDGIRALTTDEGLISRSGKLIRNKHIQETLKGLPAGLDGELIGVPEGDEWVDIPSFQQCTKAVMRANGKPRFVYVIFDCFQFPDEPYTSRLWQIFTSLREHGQSALDSIDTLKPTSIETAEQLEEIVAKNLSEGFEGTMIRKPESPYKFGRSTPREGGLLKVKKFCSDEARVTGFVEETHNPIGREIYALEQQERMTPAQQQRLVQLKGSPQKDQLKGKGTLGALIVDYQGQELRIGTGFDAAQRSDIWFFRRLYLGSLAKFKYFPIGVKDLPRHPVFEGFRDIDDL